MIIDYQIGLYGDTSNDVGFFEGLLAAMHGVLYAWWVVAVAIAYSGSRAAHISAMAVTIGWATVLANGAVGLAAAPPLSAGFPFQDMAHLGNLIFGGWSVYLSIRMLRQLPSRSG